MRRVAFVDRDGTLIVEPPDEQIDTLEKLEPMPGIVQGLALLQRHGYELVMVSNQDGLGSDSYPREAFEIVQRKLLRLLEGAGIRFESILICPHRAEDRCVCRKPATGLLDPLIASGSVDVMRSVVIGDRASDVDLARAIGCRSVL